MRLPVPVLLTLVAIRELIRAMALPLHALIYLPWKNVWKRRAQGSDREAIFFQ